VIVRLPSWRYLVCGMLAAWRARPRDGFRDNGLVSRRVTAPTRQEHVCRGRGRGKDLLPRLSTPARLRSLPGSTVPGRYSQWLRLVGIDDKEADDGRFPCSRAQDVGRRRPPQSALVGSIIVLMREMRLTGNPPALAWLRMSASFSAR
jgi:hypothetical protein